MQQRMSMYINKRVCVLQSPTDMSSYVCNTAPFPGPSVDRVSGGVGGAGLLEKWQSPAV